MLLTRAARWPMLRLTPSGQRSNLNRAEAVQDGGAPYQRRVSATREVCPVVLPRHSQLCTHVNDTESAHITIDSIWLVWYWLMLAMACRLLQRRRVLSLLGRGPGTHVTGTFAGSILVRHGLAEPSGWPATGGREVHERPVVWRNIRRNIQRYWLL